ncbi:MULTISPECIES: hypothetical protein [Bradyrhizobium]|uniref:Uncharacterized protein n=1 Tax=Bradyrhizobium septentrionale TaxID=1404411 RepID=A0A973VX23_9BRAD|nr:MULTISPECIES: hypothetical protein [Bradyrhizobium]QIG93835.1 hypothetical protein G6P99_15945 [Bradyrhizobium sp. 6(2017)]UGY12492.1 hypothetical protein HAP48_0028145 [Bradyrhizobium septentrionale]UGY21493.1 hypothetical protein HU675_0026055 [Bradyrhizobium septentrionale]UGY25028.1 hypothetical protein HU675_0045395 [Bradyrhizobium septentrionale]
MTQLAKYDAMCRAIGAAYKVDEVKAIRDRAVALEHYSRQAHNTEAERQACEIRLRAERKAGELLRKLPKAKGGQPSKKNRYPEGSSSLKANGITHKQSANWQKLAAIPEKQFEAALTDQTQMPTTNGIIRATEPPKITPVAKEALWLWGRLMDFARDDGLLHRHPEDILETMTPDMLDDVHTLAPRVAAWLKRIGATDGT